MRRKRQESENWRKDSNKSELMNRNLQSFKVSVEKVRRELEEAIIDMYAHLHLFQEATRYNHRENNQIQTKLTQYKTIREGIDDIDRWIIENPDAPLELYRPSKEDKKIDCMHLTIVNRWGRELIRRLPNQWKYAQGYTKLHRN
jgi:hypothetical protein